MSKVWYQGISETANRVESGQLQFWSEPSEILNLRSSNTLESGIDVGQAITTGPGKSVKKNKHRALNKRRA